MRKFLIATLFAFFVSLPVYAEGGGKYITPSEFEVFAPEMVGQTVKMKGEFRRVNQVWVNYFQLGNDTVGFFLEGTDDKLMQLLIADKSEFGRKLISLKKYSEITVTGQIVKHKNFADQDKYLLKVSKIKVSDSKE